MGAPGAYGGQAAPSAGAPGAYGGQAAAHGANVGQWNNQPGAYPNSNPGAPPAGGAWGTPGASPGAPGSVPGAASGAYPPGGTYFFFARIWTLLKIFKNLLSTNIFFLKNFHTQSIVLFLYHGSISQ